MPPAISFHLILRSGDPCVVGWRSYGFVGLFAIVAFYSFRVSEMMWRDSTDWESRSLAVVTFLCAIICVVSVCEILVQNWRG